MSRSAKPKTQREWSKPQRAEFNRVCTELARIGKLDSADRSLIWTYIDVWGLYQLAVAKVRETGLVIKHEHNGVAGLSLELKIAKELARQLLSFLRAMELTPAARSKAAANKPIDEDEDLEI